jgi:hypothetical protein
MILLISTYVQIICKVYLMKDGGAKEYNQSALILGSLAGMVLSKCVCTGKAQKNQSGSQSN